jgi:hypothetical protein
MEFRILMGREDGQDRQNLHTMAQQLLLITVAHQVGVQKAFPVE